MGSQVKFISDDSSMQVMFVQAMLQSKMVHH